MTTPFVPQNPCLINAQSLAEGIAWLLLRSDWCMLYAIPQQEVSATAALVAEYVLGADDCEFSYAAEGYSNQDSLSNLISEHELDLRCRAALPDAPEHAKFAAALVYFRYCYDHNEFMELRYLAELAPVGADDDAAPTAFIQQLCPTFIYLEQCYNESMKSEWAR